MKREAKTYRENGRTGEKEFSRSIGAFPAHLHQKIKDLSSRDQRTTQIYSEAISSLRHDIATNQRPSPIKPNPGGADIKIWISERANNDLVYLTKKMKCDHRTIVHTAIVRWLEKKGRGQ